MFERRTFERELAELGVGWGGFAEREMLSAKYVDLDAAEPKFSDLVRKKIGPLLGNDDIKKAVKHNAAQHPKVSELDLETLRYHVEAYIDRPSLEKAIGKTVDDATITAQLVHQFQQKIFREPGFHTGKLDEQTLDALGFVRHRGKKLNKADRGHDTALDRIKKAWNPKLVESGGDITADTWFSYMVDAPFLGLTTRHGSGIHLELMRRLRRAQRYLVKKWGWKYQNSTPVELGDMLLWDPKDGPAGDDVPVNDKFGNRHRGNRPGKVKTPMHHAGLAIDLAYRSNPWIGNATFTSVTARAAKAIGGTNGKQGLSRALLQKLGASGKSTEEIYDELARWNGWLEQYLAGSGSQVVTDKKALKSKGLFLQGRDPAQGFLSQHRDLVVALRDGACLAWGACDMGGASGDIMHFDCRVDGIGRAYLEQHNKIAARSGGKSGAFPKSHPCLDAAAGKEIDEELKAQKLPRSIGGKLCRLKSRTGGGVTAVYVPSAAAGTDPLSLIVWIHGDLICGGEGDDAVSLVKSNTFPLCQRLAASGKPFVLAVPSMPWATNNASHTLGTPEKMNAFLEEIRSELTNAGWSSAPSFGRVVIAGHSRAYVVLNGLVKNKGDAAWSSGGLAKVSDLWLLDTTYAKGKTRVEQRCDQWTDFLKAMPDVTVCLLYRLKSATAELAECIRDQGASLGNLRVAGFDPKTLKHCPMPREQLHTLLGTL